MSKVTMLNMEGKEAGQIELKDEIFGIEPNQNAVHAVVKNILANRRQGTQSAKTRAEVRGGGRKPGPRPKNAVSSCTASFYSSLRASMGMREAACFAG